MFIDELKRHIESGERCHLVGIGGVSMSPLAEVLRVMGVDVTGSDIYNSPSVQHLRSIGISVAVGHSAENVRGAGFLIRTAAAHDDNAEIIAAREAGIPVYERAQAWGYIMRRYKNAVCIAGAHGKTTTTSMLTYILLAAETDPTIMIGGILPKLGSGYRVGKGNVIALEADEYYNSFHSFYPTVAVVLNIDADHLDFFKDLDDLKGSFRKFASLVPESGHIVCNGDDENTMQALAPLGRELLTFGHGFGARIRGVNVNASGRNPTMSILYDGKPFCDIRLMIPGAQNLRNALAATAAAIALEIPAGAIVEGLNTYTGVGRRFEFKGVINGADVYDDYAHHPSEIRALLDAVKSLDYSRIIVAFQPHTYSRTRALFPDFVTELSRPDVTYLAEIYAAREPNDISISSNILANAVPGAKCCASLHELTEELARIAREGDIILTVGAGDITTVSDALIAFH